MQRIITTLALALAVMFSGCAAARDWTTATGPAYQDAPASWRKHWQCDGWQRSNVIKGYVTTSAVSEDVWRYTHHKGKPPFGGVSYVCSK